jgi:hypothetical protein
MLDKIQYYWNKIQDLLDVSGDSIMFVMTSVFIARIAFAMFGYKPLNGSEAAMYASAIGAFSYSNKGPKS